MISVALSSGGRAENYWLTRRRGGRGGVRSGCDVDPKEPISIRLDSDVLHWFRSKGARYQTRINAVLRSYVNAMKRKGPR